MRPAEFQQCYRMLPEPMLLLSADGELQAVNAAATELFGRTPAGLAGVNLREFAVEPERLSRILSLCRRTTEMLPGALVLRRQDGSEVACRTEGAVLADAAGNGTAQILLRLLAKEKTTSRFLALNDRIDSLNKEITKRHQAQAALAQTNESLRRANAELEQFAYSASHDLREPLRMVALYSQLLKRRYEGRLDAQADEFLEFTVEGARRMEALVADLFAYTQLVIGGGGPAGPIAADIALDRALSNLAGAIEESGARIERQPLPDLFVEEVHLVQLFQNLIGNAIKYRSELTPVIGITVEPGKTMWRISVHDNGIGISPQYAHQVFGIFKRLHSSEAYPGTGIGLAICQKIVHRYGGSIWIEPCVESRKDGRGTTFRFTLPGGERFSGDRAS